MMEFNVVLGQVVWAELVMLANGEKNVPAFLTAAIHQLYVNRELAANEIHAKPLYADAARLRQRSIQAREELHNQIAKLNTQHQELLTQIALLRLQSPYLKRNGKPLELQ